MPRLCNLVKTAAVDVANFIRIPLFLDMTQSLIREEQNPLLIRCKNCHTNCFPVSCLNLSLTIIDKHQHMHLTFNSVLI